MYTPEKKPTRPPLVNELSPFSRPVMCANGALYNETVSTIESYAVWGGEESLKTYE